MRKRIGLLAAAILPWTPGYLLAQATSQPTDQQIHHLEQRIDEMDRKYQNELKIRDEEIDRLKAAQGTTEKVPTATTQPNDIDAAKNDVLKDIEANHTPPAILRTPVSFNPDLAVVTDFRGNISTAKDNPARNRFDIGSVELDLRAAVAPSVDGVAVIPISREADDPLFFDPANVNNAVETGVEIEEAYASFHDFGIPNLTAKLGRFHLRFGRQNILHSHDWPTFDNNFVNQSFLGSEALTDNGLSLSYVIPPKLIGGNYVEAIAEVISGEGGGDEAPVLNNTMMVDGPAVNTRLLWNHDIGQSWNMELGGSFLAGKHDDDNSRNSHLYGADFTLVHTDPTGGFNNQLIQGEAIYGDVGTEAGTQHSNGFYLLGQQQINRDWYTGLRLDWTENAIDDSQEVWGVSPYITWYFTEFMRFRLEYQHKAGDVPTEDNLFFQATWIFGAHPPHPYWAMR